MNSPINGADTAWMLVSTALVLLMTPALGFFYGGLVRGKNALNTMMMSVSALGFVGLAWALVGYSLAFSSGSDLVGGLSRVALRVVAILAVAVYSAGASWALLKVVNAIAPLRVSKREEGLGLDVSQHGEEAYVRGEGALLILRAALPEAALPRTSAAAASLRVVGGEP